MVVHHVRYPKVLGEEKLAWLYSLCVPCHDEIHRLHSSMTLRKATAHVLGQPPPPADWRAHRVQDTKRLIWNHRHDQNQRSPTCTVSPGLIGVPSGTTVRLGPELSVWVSVT